ncbi:hypothetical protein EI42_00999 [Thermosporothrix hazakensis]|jgi:D-serine deaminase-like pyridoxal phosphate-dependent protein|uniref:Uncharacterized protein n=2 Tax=Thermosporothrix TaxID=768650 RepID=A0A326UWY8_THEHA|nr:hypothetical protein [Thermosporothrix hazakensis]PZW36813.1 hypothetical protein EI42_00999 [Thermosporothrix hazakensis]BBH89279.1 hypothetical protein KTC_40300 [Thermosporothrix sp. COM3]GCE47462.1 hypothetical protein KTH_23310 [Thermosporothrix hazakensis]
MADGSFNELYRDTLKDVFLRLANEQLEQGADGLTCADTYAEQGKPEFTLAYLLLTEVADEVKRDILARAYEQRALLSEQKAEAMAEEFHRPFPMIKVEAQKDRTAARQVRSGKRLRRETRAISIQLN